MSKSTLRQPSPLEIEIHAEVMAFNGTLKEAVTHVAAKRGYKIPSVYGIRRRVEKWNEEQGAPKPIMPEGQKLRRVSTLVDAAGNPKLQWIITDQKKDDWQTLIDAAIDRLTHIEPIPPTTTTGGQHAPTTTVYPIADWHVGIGTTIQSGWTLDKAADTYRDAFGQLVANSAPSGTALLVFLGDFTHTDDDKNVTPRSGKKLDVSGNYAEIVQTAMQLVVDAIAMAQQRHAVVEVAYLAGNHDQATAVVMQAVLRHLYSQQSNIVIHTTSQFFYKPVGKTLLAFTHGHLTKREALPMIMAIDVPLLWGAARYRVWHTGHIHHKTMQEFPGCTVESHSAPTPRDAWHEESGYRSHRAMTSITYDDTGEKARASVNL